MILKEVRSVPRRDGDTRIPENIARLVRDEVQALKPELVTWEG